MRIAEAAAVAIVTLGTAQAAQLEGRQDSWALRQFNHQIASYMALRQDVESRVPPPVVTSNTTEIVTREAALARGIRQARSRAKLGDIFGPQASFEIRNQIRQVLDRHSVSASGLLADLGGESPHHFATPTVNGAFDWRFGAMMPAAIIDALPQLPWPLQYRFVYRDLMVLDVDASVILDVLPNALDGP